MRAFTIFLILFTFVMLSTQPATESAAGANEFTPRVESGFSRTDPWVLRLASDFSIVQGKIADMMVHDNPGNRTTDNLVRIEKTLREDVMRVIGAAAMGDHEMVRVLLPTVARQVRQQILILVEDDGVARQWVAARGKTWEMASRNSLLGPEASVIALARIE